MLGALISVAGAVLYSLPKETVANMVAPLALRFKERRATASTRLEEVTAPTPLEEVSVAGS